jgi:N-carbamoyl-L-amino-acid hydrolase
MTLQPEIDGERLLRRLDAFAGIGATPAGGVNRQALSVEDRSARRLLAELALERGFTVFQDGLPNLFIRREGSDTALPLLLIGSHLDSQPAGGRFDGALGTLSAFEALEALEDAKAQTRMPVEVVAWTNEEGSRFAPGVMGSMAFASDSRQRRRVPGNRTRCDDRCIAGGGGAADRHADIRLHRAPSNRDRCWKRSGCRSASSRPSRVRAGWKSAFRVPRVMPARPALHSVGIRWLPPTHRLQATIMSLDADARPTVGRIAAQPGSINAIPQSVIFTVDLRHPQPERLDAIEAEVRQVCRTEAEARNCTAAIARSFDMPGAAFSPDMIDVVEEAVNSLRLPHKRMISGAFHDALHRPRGAGCNDLRAVPRRAQP